MVPAGLGGCARMSVAVSADDGAIVEYIPDPLILFDGTEAQTGLDVKLASDAVGIVADAVVFHNPDGGLPTSGQWRNTIRFSVEGDEGPRLVERQALDLGNLNALALGAAEPQSCYGALYCFGIEARGRRGNPVRRARHARHGRAIACQSGLLGGQSLICQRHVGARFLCRDGATLTAALEAAWMGARRAYSAGHPARRRK